MWTEPRRELGLKRKRELSGGCPGDGTVEGVRHEVLRAVGRSLLGNFERGPQPPENHRLDHHRTDSAAAEQSPRKLLVAKGLV